MMNLVEVAAGEAGKALATSLVHGAGTAASRLHELVKTKLGALPADPVEFRAKAIARAELDTEFREQLIEAVAQLNADQPAAVALFPDMPFFDRAQWFVDPPTAGVKIIAGLAGSGKTALAYRLAAQVRDRFSAGCVDIDLDDYRDGSVCDLDAVKRHIIGRFGIGTGDIPLDSARLDQQFRSVTVTRRFVLILDNAANPDEIAPFAKVPQNLVLVTMSSLDRRTQAAYPHPISLEGLDDEGAKQLLADRSDQAIVDAEPDAVAALLALCGNLPYAINQVAVTLARRKGEPKPVAGLLADYQAKGIVDAEGAIQDSLRRTFDSLPPLVAQAATLLSQHPGNYFTRRTAVAYLGGEAAEEAFDGLRTAQLLEPSGAWYRLSPLAAEYARKIGADGRETALDRLLAYVRIHAVAADFEDNDERLRAYVVPPGKHRWTLPEQHIDWLDEHRALALELARIALHSGQYKEVCQLAGAFEVLVNTRGRWSWFAELSELYVEAARRSHEERGNHRLLARALMMRAKTRYLARHFTAARPDLDEARAILAGITERGGRDRQVAASLMQFDGRYHEEYAEAARVMIFDPGDEREDERKRQETIARELAAAAWCLREAVRIDIDLGDQRAIGIDQRMLASMLIKGGGSLDEASSSLARAFELARNDKNRRNEHRVRMVYIRLFLAAGDVAKARVELDFTGAAVGGSQYTWEWRELEARVLEAEGRKKEARKAWDALAVAAFRCGHPRGNEYFRELGRLR